MPTSTEPLITRLRVTGFQSLHDIDLSLAPLTVIVGPSSSGKSALVRALRTLTNNARGTAFVTTGFKSATIAATLSSGETVTLRRSTGTKAADNSYTLTYPAGSSHHEPPDGAVFTKLAGEVPEEIRTALGLPNDPTLTFASQFDKPYLLDASPQEVARALAALTNVHVIFEASREANRTRLAHSATLRTRTEDLAAVTARTEEFKNLAAQRTAQERAEDALAAARQVTTRLTNLTNASFILSDSNTAIALYGPMAHAKVPSLEIAERLASDAETVRYHATALRIATRHLDEAAKAAQTTVPSLADVQAARIRLSDYRDVLVALRTAKSAMKDASAAHQSAAHDLVMAQAEYIGALETLGTCPTCGQDTHTITSESVDKIHA